MVAKSNEEAEYRIMSLATRELIWVKHLKTELGYAFAKLMHILKSSIHKITKQIEIDCHFIKDKI